MRPPRLAATTLLLALALSPALAQAPKEGPGGPSQPSPPGPYKQLPVTLPNPLGDATLDAFRKDLGDIAKRKDRAALAGRIVAKGFFWQRFDGKPADPKKSGIDLLAAAIGLDAQDGSGWEALAGYAEEPTAEAVPDLKGVVCSPAGATFNAKDLEQVTQATKTDWADWVYPTVPGVEVHATADAKSPVVDKLGLYLVRVLPEQSPPSAAAADWAQIVTPAGKVGFVASSTLASLGNEQLCYVKDASGWHIAGYAGGGDQQ